MAMLLLFGLMLLNFGISWWNAYVVGSIWRPSRESGGWQRVIAWAGAIQSAAGFTMVLGIVISFIAFAGHIINQRAFQAVLNLNYLMIIFPIIGSGLIITAHSIKAAYERRDFATVGTAIWNTGASAYNIYEATSSVPSAWENVADFFKSDSEDSDDTIKAIVLLLVVIAAGLGVLLTYLIAHAAMVRAEQRRLVVASGRAYQ